MHRSKWLAFSLLFPAAAACAQGATLEGVGGSGRGGGTPVGTGGGTNSGSSGSSTSGQASSSGTSGNVPSNCNEAGGDTGCCAGNTLYYCAKSSSTITEKACPSGQACGWSSSKGYYACVAPPGEPDPDSQYPLACP